MEKYFCGECKKMLDSSNYNKTKKEGRYIKRDGHLPICKKCNNNLGIRKKARKDGPEKNQQEIHRLENVIEQKRIAGDDMILKMMEEED